MNRLYPRDILALLTGVTSAALLATAAAAVTIRASWKIDKYNL